MDTSEREPAPMEHGRDAAGSPAPTGIRPAGPWHERAGRPLRTALALALVTAVTGGVLLVVRTLASEEFLASGDTVRGTYTARPADGDAAAAAVRAGPYTERPGPPVAASRSGTSAPLPASRPLTATPTAAAPPIGALFAPGDDGDAPHHCTASVVDSPAGDLVVTAAHCVHDGGFRTRLVFAPGYHDGVVPYGLWVPTRIEIDPRWVNDRDPDYDVAFLRVRAAGGARPRIQDVTGAERIRFDAPAGRPAQLTGYPNDLEQPVGCRHTADAQSPTQLRFACAGFPNGTSGGPMLTDLDRATGTGSLIGVVGGLDGGGDDTTSYSSRFGAEIAALYRRATG
ncbi:trypsin-like serine peptidase [Streptomyces celluloflavus]|uniref:trypsin-like serine peptidase n=1 Tax=Streptomyces celluloflavus TaxID=58344 RepID=UPI0036A75526